LILIDKDENNNMLISFAIPGFCQSPMSPARREMPAEGQVYSVDLIHKILSFSQFVLT